MSSRWCLASGAPEAAIAGEADSFTVPHRVFRDYLLCQRIWSATETVEIMSKDPQSEAEISLWKQVVSLWEMEVRQDLESIQKALHQNYSGWVTGKDQAHDYHAALASVGPSAPRVLRYTLKPLKITVFDDHVGVVHYTYEAEVQAERNVQETIRGRWTEMYLRKSGAWQMIAVSGGPDGQR